MKKKIRNKILFVMTIIGAFGIATFVNYDRRDTEQDLKLIKRGDLVMCTAEKIGNNVPPEGTVVHVIEAMSIRENAVEDRELRGWILNNDVVVSGIVGYEELHKNCEGEVIFVEAESKKERDINNGITTKGLPYEITYLPPLPTQSF